MAMSLEPHNKEELLENIDRSWRGLQAAAGRYRDEQFEVRDLAGWSAKDHLAHVAMWERSTLELLRDGRSQYVTLGIERELVESREETKFEKINAILHARSADWSLSRVKTDDVHRALIALLDSMPAEELARPWSALEPGTHETPILLTLDQDCTGHYDEHRLWIEELIGARSSRSA